jgi:hypothetical protein
LPTTLAITMLMASRADTGSALTFILMIHHLKVTSSERGESNAVKEPFDLEMSLRFDFCHLSNGEIDL